MLNSTVLFVGFGLMALQALSAYTNDMLTPGQMRSGGIWQGLPLLAHGGMWGDVFVTLLGAYLVGEYEKEWSLSAWALALCVGSIVSAVMHWVYTKSDMPEAHVLNQRLTGAGWLHAVYMAVALAVFFLFYLDTRCPPPTLLWGATGLLIVHIAIGNHFVLGWIRPAWYPGTPLKSLVSWVTVIGSAAILIAATIWNTHS